MGVSRISFGCMCKKFQRFLGIACMVICVCFGYYVSCSFLDLGVIAEEIVDGTVKYFG